MTIRKRNAVPRHEADFYKTSRECVEGLLSVERIEGRVWECACGDGAISKILKINGFDVVSTDLHDRGYGEGGIDFLECDELRAPVIITNPPYGHRLSEAFVAKALDLGCRKLYLFMRLAWLEGDWRLRNLFYEVPPTRVHVLSFRPTLWHGDDAGARDSGGAIPYAWYVWDLDALPLPAGFLGNWIARPPEATGLQTSVFDQEWNREILNRALRAWTAAELCDLENSAADL